MLLVVEEDVVATLRTDKEIREKVALKPHHRAEPEFEGSAFGRVLVAAGVFVRILLAKFADEHIASDISAEPLGSDKIFRLNS